MVILSRLPFPRPMPRSSLINVVDNLHKLIEKKGITPDQLVVCAELVRDNVRKIDAARGYPVKPAPPPKER